MAAPFGCQFGFNRRGLEHFHHFVFGMHKSPFAQDANASVLENAPSHSFLFHVNLYSESMDDVRTSGADMKTQKFVLFMSVIFKEMAAVCRVLSPMRENRETAGSKWRARIS